uniref:F-box domain-containing protein n=1 Tax=Brassica oleracea var. oleracea TaxID=109376 RepID=A0A0D3DVP6_BRAOL
MSPSASVAVARVLSSPAAMRQNPLKRKRDHEITVHEEDDVHEYTKPRPPSWEALCVLGPYMDPETLAVASCVSTTRLECFSSDDLWKALLTTTSSQRSSPYEIFGPNYKFQIKADVSNATITADEDDVRMTWQVMYKGKFFTIADTTRSLGTKNGWFTDKLEDKCNRKLVGDVKPSFKGEVLEKIEFSIVDSDGWGSLLLDGFLRYLQLFLLE